ncbi:MAG: phasin family protein [Pseudomonadota bacterium]
MSTATAAKAKTTPAKKTTKKTAAKKAAPKSVATNENDPTAAFEAYSEAAREKFVRVTEDFSEGAEQMRETLTELAGDLSERATHTGEQVSAMTSELMDAAKDEVTDAVQFANDLMKAKSFGDALEIQREYWTDLFQARTERARDLSERAMALTKDNLDPITDKASALFRLPKNA